MLTATATRTLSINAAFLDEIKQNGVRLRELLDELARSCAGAAMLEQRLRPLCRLLHELRDQLALHFALEEAFGYFEDPLYVAPEVCEQCEELREEHAELYLEIAELADAAADLAYLRLAGPSVSDLLHECADFHRRLCAHEAGENELIWRAFELDLGVGD